MDLSRDEGRTDGSPLADVLPWTCTVTGGLPRRFTVSLEGALQAGWAARLARGLATRRISVVHARAHRAPSRSWSAQLDVLAAEGVELDAAAIDWILTDRSPLEGRASAPPVKRFVLTPGREDLEVQLRAPDSVGFLDRLFRLFAFYGLFPSELAIDTVRGEVRDTFRLRTMTGDAPSARTREALGRKLASLAAA